jgi:hypothetical protein
MSAALALARSPAQVLVGDWFAEIDALDPWVKPCQGAVLRHWPRARQSMLDFLDTWGETAVGLGWTDVRLFGVHRLAAMDRVDSCGGAAFCFPTVVEAMDAHHIHYANGLVHCGMTNPADSIPLWDFVRSARARAG